MTPERISRSPEDAELLHRVEPLTGRTVGDFLIGEQLGGGGFGVIYHAEQLTLGREVVVKVLRQQPASDDGRAQRFLREAQLASRLDHPYAAHIYAFGIEEDGLFWIAMELVRGIAMKEFLATRGPFSLARFVPFLERICEVVYTAHEQGIIHRDIKPSNVMVLSRAGRLLPKLLDLGIARLLSDEIPELELDDPSESAIDIRAMSEAIAGVDSGPTTVTLGERALGSPPYMAPEQWGRAFAADARADQYSLAVLAYEAITGQRPFQSDDTAVLAAKHLRGQVPPLGPDLPASLNSVFTRALAKKPDERYTDVLEFAREFRAASGLERDADESLPRLDSALRDALLARAPQPLADSIALLDSGSDPRRAALAATQITRVLVRLLGILAIAGFTRVGLGGAQGLEAIRVALRRFRQESLSLGEWLASARALVQPFADKPDAHPIPELVLVLTERPGRHSPAGGPSDDESDDESDDAPDDEPDSQPASQPDDAPGDEPDGQPVDALDDKLDGQPDDAPEVEPDDKPDGSSSQLPVTLRLKGSVGTAADTRAYRRPGSDMAPADSWFPILDQLLVLEKDFAGPEPLTALEACLPVLEQLLRRLSFLADYRIVARHRGRDEVRMGARRAARPTLIVRGLAHELGEGDVVLVGDDGAQVLRLSPWCRLLAPAPGALAEMFFFDGKSRLGARLRAFPIGFEWNDTEFWPWYHNRLHSIDPDLDDPEAHIETNRRTPYLGLSAFSPADSDNFFGREREVGHCVNRLLVAPLLTIVGPSGAGKSSFVQAGILPSLPGDWRALVVRPGTTPVVTLCARLHTEWLAKSHPDLTRDDLRKRIEQDPNALAQLLGECARGDDTTLVIVIDQFEELVTLGADEEARRWYLEALMAAIGQQRESVRLILTVRDDFLLRVQALPALRERLGESLQLLATPPVDDLERILIEPARRLGYEFEDDALPREMVEAIADEPGALALLSFTAAKLWELRDVEKRQLQRSAYRELGGVGGALAQHAEETLERMSRGHRDVVRQAFRHLVTAQGTRAVLTRRELSELLSRERDAAPVIEALIGARLLVASEGEGGQDRVEVVHEALLSSWPRLVRWQREDAESARLRDQLRAAARQWTARGRPRGLLWRGDALLEYRLWRARYDGALTDAEQQFARMSVADEERGVRRRKAITIAAFSILVVGLMFMWYLQRRANDAYRRADSERQRAEQFAEDSRSNAKRAHQRLIDLYREQGRQALLEGDALRALPYLAEARHEGANSPDLRFLLARASDALSDQRLVIDTGDDTLWAMAMSPDGTLIASGDRTGLIQLWSVRDGRSLGQLRGHTDDIWTLAFNADGSRLLSGSWDGSARVWNVAAADEVWSAPHQGQVRWTAFDRDGTRVVTSGTDKVVTIRAADSGAVLTQFTADAAIASGAVSADGTLVAIGDGRGGSQIRDLESGTLVLAPSAHSRPVMALAFSPDSTRVASGSWDGGVGLASLSGEQLARPSGHRRAVNRVYFASDGRHLLTVSEDKTAALWATDTGKMALELTGHEGGVTDAAFNSSGRRVTTVGRDGRAIAWNPQNGTRIWTYLGHREGIWRVALHAASQTLATAGLGGEIRLWDAEHTEYAWAVTGLPSEAMDAVFSPDGQRVAVVREQPESKGVIVEIFAIAVGEGGPDTERSPAAISSFIDEKAELGVYGARVAWAPNGRLIAVTGGAATTVLDATQMNALTVVSRLNQRARHGIFGPMSDSLYTVGDDHIGNRWDLVSGKSSRRFSGHTDKITFVDLDHSGRYLLTASDDQRARIWDTNTGEQVKNLASDTKRLTGARFSADGTRVITSSVAQSARIYSVEGELITSLDGHTDAVLSAAISPDGQLAATGSRDGTVKVWNARTGGLLWTTESRGKEVHAVRFDATGERLLVTQGAGATIWATHYDDRTPAQIRAFSHCRSGYQLRESRLEYVKPDHAQCNARQ